jgi:hypothetical protein
MANVKLSELPSATNPIGVDDNIVGIQGGIDVIFTGSQLPASGLPTGSAPLYGDTADQILTTNLSDDAVLNILPTPGNTGSAILELDSFGNSSYIFLSNANGTSGSPTATANGDLLSQIYFAGYGASQYKTSTYETVLAAEDFDDFHYAVTWTWVTQSLDETSATRFSIDGNGVFNVGAVTGPAPAFGDVNIAGQYKVNGVPLPTLAIGTAPLFGDVANQILSTDPSDDAVLNIIPTAGSANAVLELDSFENEVDIIYTRANGTVGTPSQALSGDFISLISSYGYGASGYQQGTVTLVVAAEDFDDSHYAVISRWSTQSLDETFDIRFFIDGNGVFNVGAVSGPAPVFGDINIAGQYKVNGTVLPVGPVGSGSAVAISGAATLNQDSGVITSEALIAATSYTLTLTNSNILSTSTVIVNQTNSANLPVTLASVTPASGSVVIVVGMAALTGTVKISFIVCN